MKIQVVKKANSSLRIAEACPWFVEYPSAAKK
jgi:hypothetical protein